MLKDVAAEIDFTWIDWQQGGAVGGALGGKQNPTLMLNKLRVTSPKRQSAIKLKRKRGMVLSRWGGLGSHRYPVGFSGDVGEPGEKQLSWANLAYQAGRPPNRPRPTHAPLRCCVSPILSQSALSPQPYFSITAANVAYGYWSHDVQGPAETPEMYVRWVQWATYSGVFRLHDRGLASGDCAGDEPDNTDRVQHISKGNHTPTKVVQDGVGSDFDRVDYVRGNVATSSPSAAPRDMSNVPHGVPCTNVRPWEVGLTRVSEQYYAPIRAAMVARAELVPYLYTLAREAFSDGLAPLRPMCECSALSAARSKQPPRTCYLFPHRICPTLTVRRL